MKVELYQSIYEPKAGLKNEVKNKIPNITNSVTTTALSAFQNKIPNVSNIVKNN